MDTLEVVYYTCLNNECPKHRNVFMEGDPQHERCERERLYLEGQEPAASRWPLWAIPVALAAAVAAIVLVRVRRQRKFKPPMLRGESEMQTWSGAHAHRDDREGNTVPPPIAER